MSILLVCCFLSLSSLSSLSSFLIKFFCAFSIFFYLLKRPSSLSFSLNPLLKIILNGEYSNLACLIVFGFKPRSSPVKYSYLSKLLEDNEDILAAFLSKSYYVSFCRIFLFKILI